MSTESGSLAAALAAAQAELRDPRREKAGQVRGRRDYKYAGLDDLLQTVRPILSKHGLAVAQLVDIAEGRVLLLTELLHSSGQLLVSRYPLEWAGNPQERGSELTYARRYSLEAIVGVAATDDDAPMPSPSLAPSEGAPPSESVPALASGDGPELPWDEEWAATLAGVGLTLDEAVWWFVARANTRSHPRDMNAARRSQALAWILSESGAAEVRAGLTDVRERLRRAFFAKWNVMFPSPRKRDGASDEERDTTQEYSERCRRAVLAAWYGTGSIKLVPVREALQGKHSIRWLSVVSQPDFEAAVDEVLGDPSATGELDASGGEAA